MTMRSFLLASCLLLVFGEAIQAQPQDQASPAMASLSGGTVVVRQFMLPMVAMPGTERPGRPKDEPAEFRLTFNAADVQAFHPDGKPVASATWQQQLGQETPVLFGGYAIVAPGAPAAQRQEINLPSEMRQVYRADALVLMGNRPPIKQEPVKNPKLPAGSMPRFGSASLLEGGWLRVVERQQVRSHYDARFGHGSGPASDVYQTTVTTTTRDVQADHARMWDLDGKQIPATSLGTLLTKETPAVISADGKPVDAFFLRLARPGSLVVAVPMLVPSAVSPVAPRPAPPSGPLTVQ